jgi:hypothetical protein
MTNNAKDEKTVWNMEQAAAVIYDWALRLQRNQPLLPSEQHTLSVVLMTLTNMIYEQTDLMEGEAPPPDTTMTMADLCELVRKP